MSSVCGGLDYKDAETHLTSSSASSPNKCSDASNHISGIGSEDAQESDGDDSSNIHQYVNEASTIPELLPLKSSDVEGEDKNLSTALQDMFSENMSAVTVIPAIKGSREKHGKSVEKQLSVSWAEDVYDPPPSLVSHTRNKKQQQQKSKSRDSLKKNGKKGQKGSSNSSSSRGSKDKKSSTSSRSKDSGDKFGWASQMSIVAAS